MKKRRLAGIDAVWLVVPLVGLAVTSIRPIRDNSFLWHITAGHLQNASGRVLTMDPFSLSFLGQPWRTQSWLLELIYAWLGDDLRWVGTFVALVAGVTLVAAGVAIYQATRSVRWTSGLVIWLQLLALPYFAPRPVLVSFAFLALLLLALRTRRLRWTIPLIMWVWASMHGSFVLGGGLIVLDGLARRDLRRITDATASAVSVTLTAHGWHVWGILIGFFKSSDSLKFIGEWAPPDVLSRGTLPFTALLMAMLVMAARSKTHAAYMWIVAPFVVFGLSSARAIMPAGVVLIVLLAHVIGGRTPRPSEPSLVATVAVLVVVVGSVFVWYSGDSELDTARFPVVLADKLIDVPTFHDDVVGGYLIFRQANPTRVLLDDRAELYSPSFIESVVEVRHGTPEWSEFFADHGIDQVLVRSDDGLVDALRVDAGWYEVSADENFTVWRRSGS